jgi:thioredoxin 1
MLAPIVEELSEEFTGKAVVGKVDVDTQTKFAGEFGIRNIPTVLIFKDGEMVQRQVGVAPKTTYVNLINENM